MRDPFRLSLLPCLCLLPFAVAQVAPNAITGRVVQLDVNVDGQSDAKYLILGAKIHLKVRNRSTVPVVLGPASFVERIDRWDTSSRRWLTLFAVTIVEGGIPKLPACRELAPDSRSRMTSEATIPIPEGVLTGSNPESIRLKAFVTTVCSREDGAPQVSRLVTRPFRLRLPKR